MNKKSFLVLEIMVHNSKTPPTILSKHFFEDKKNALTFLDSEILEKSVNQYNSEGISLSDMDIEVRENVGYVRTEEFNHLWFIVDLT